ncbi:small-conductance mechanosensitive channel/CRP-like cAMP-binding protein [Oxalobacteraceae bacterium GrIS 2.11]
MADAYHLLTERPELWAIACLLLGMFVTRWSASRAPATRLILRLPVFLLFTYLLFQAHQVPYLATVPPGDALARIASDLFRAVWWFWGAAIASNAIRNFTYRGSQHKGQRFFIDLCVAMIYVFAFVGLITFVFNFPMQGVLVTSGAVAVVLGLALQSSLGDVFYGVVLNLSKPYREGDWIALDNGVEGRVLEMNWRATHIITVGQDVVIVPNSMVAKSKIINSSFPSQVHGTTIQIMLAANTFPMSARRILSEVIHGCHLVLLLPTPLIVIKAMSQEGIAVDITFFTSEIRQSVDAQNQIYEKIFRSLGAAGIGFGTHTTAFQNNLLQATSSLNDDVERLVAFTPIFARLPVLERKELATLLLRETFDAKQTVVEYGSNTESMYIVGSGVLSLTREVAGHQIEIARMSTADHFGAGGLLGGSQTLAKVTTLTSAVLYRLEKKDLVRLVNDRPGFAAGLNQELAARKIFAMNAMESHDDQQNSEDHLAAWFSSIFRRPE